MSWKFYSGALPGGKYGEASILKMSSKKISDNIEIYKRLINK